MQKDDEHYKFCLAVIKSLHLEPMQFFKSVANQEEYELIIFSWINELYKKGKSVDYSVRRIYRARHILFFKGKDIMGVPSKKKDNLEMNNSFNDLQELKHLSSTINIAS